MNGLTFEDSIRVRDTPDALIALSQDYGRRLGWDPFLRSPEPVCGATQPGLGMRAWCVAHKRLGMGTKSVPVTSHTFLIEAQLVATVRGPAGAEWLACRLRDPVRSPAA